MKSYVFVLTRTAEGGPRMTAPAGACSANHVVAPSSASRRRRVTPWPVRKGRSVFDSDSFTIDGLLTFVLDCAVYLPSRLQPMLVCPVCTQSWLDSTERPAEGFGAQPPRVRQSRSAFRLIAPARTRHPDPVARLARSLSGSTCRLHCSPPRFGATARRRVARSNTSASLTAHHPVPSAHRSATTTANAVSIAVGDIRLNAGTRAKTAHEVTKRARPKTKAVRRHRLTGASIMSAAGANRI